MKPLHSVDTVDVPFDWDTSCAAVMICVSSSTECGKRTKTFYHSCSCNGHFYTFWRVQFLLHTACCQQFSVFNCSQKVQFFLVCPASLLLAVQFEKNHAVQHFQWNSEGMHRVTHEDAYTRAWLEFCRSVLPQSVRKADPDADLFNVSTYQCSIFFNNMGSFHRKSPFRKAENVD